MYQLLNFWHSFREPRYEACMAGRVPCDCTATGLVQCYVRESWASDIVAVFGANAVADAQTGLALAGRYGANATEFGYREPRYRREWSRRVLAIVQLGEQTIAWFRESLERERASRAPGS